MTMANREARRGGHETYKELVPVHEWGEHSDEQSDVHYLAIDLPGFKEEEVKLKVDKDGFVIASGKRKVGEDKHIFFGKFYKVPEDSNTDEIYGNFKNETLYVIIPKKERGKTNEKDGVRNAAEGTNHGVRNVAEAINNQQRTVAQATAKNLNEGRFWETVKAKLKGFNMVSAAAAALAFSLGVLVSQKIQPRVCHFVPEKTIHCHGN